jgi:hypothetical protein
MYDGKGSGDIEVKPMRGNHCSLDPVILNKLFKTKFSNVQLGIVLQGND